MDCPQPEQGLSDMVWIFPWVRQATELDGAAGWQLSVGRMEPRNPAIFHSGGVYRGVSRHQLA